MSQKSKEQLKLDNINTFPNNNTGYITPERIRGFHNDVIDSMLLDSQLQTEISDRISGDTILTTLLQTEISDRLSGDTYLNSLLQTEISDRLSGDTYLNSLLQTEISDRLSGDTSLSDRIDNIPIYDDTLIWSGLTTEISDRLSGDTYLNSLLQTEISNRLSGDTYLNSLLQTEISNRLSGDTSLTLSLNNKMDVYSSITYSNLVSLISTSGLTIGKKYLINDYQSFYLIPTTIILNSGSTEPLLVTAQSTSKLEPIVYSNLYPKDIIYYSIENDHTMVSGCTKGYIYRRIDTINNNDIGFDYRNIKFRRYQLNITNVWTGSITYNIGDVVKNNTTDEIYISIVNNNLNNSLTSTDKWKRFEYDNLTYVSTTSTSYDIISGDFILSLPCSSLYMDYYMFSTNNTSGGIQSSYDTIYNNKIDINKTNLLYNTIIFGTNNFNNKIGNNFNNNTINNNFNNNIIGDNFTINSVGNYFINNNIGNYFNNNTIGNNFTNTIQNYFTNNIVGNILKNNNIYSNINNMDLSYIELYDKLYNHDLLKIDNNKYKIKWIDLYNDTNIIQSSGYTYTAPTVTYSGFTTEWVVSGDVSERTITLPFVDGYNYNCTIDWGDGNSSTVTSYNDINRIHTYSINGTYQIEIKGTCEGWSINNNADRLKITKVINWGDDLAFGGFKYLTYGFFNCWNLNYLAPGGIKGSTITSFSDTFLSCSSLTTIPSDLFMYNINVIDFYETFSGCIDLIDIPNDLFKYNIMVNNFNSTFGYCISLTTLPSDLFMYNTMVTTFNYTFQGCSLLTIIPSDLFRYNISVSEFDSTFYSTGLIDIPNDLFKYNINTNYFINTFGNCKSLIYIPNSLFDYNINVIYFRSTFQGCSLLTTIPSDLFIYNSTCYSFDSTFSDCTSLTTLPNEIFRYNTNCSEFTSTFYNCTSLTTLPSDLFRYNFNVYNFSYVFYGCTSLQLSSDIFYQPEEINTRFIYTSIYLSNCFYRNSFTGIQGIAPDLWNVYYYELSSSTGCFGGTGNSLTSISNYNDIPTNWIN